MAQAGIHAMVGMLSQKFTDKRQWLLFGIILGSFIPDMDNFGVAAATLAKLPTEGIHRTANAAGACAGGDAPADAGAPA